MNGRRDEFPEESKVIFSKRSRTSSSYHRGEQQASTHGGSTTSGHSRRYQIFGLANPRSGDGLASGFLTDYPHLNEQTLFVERLGINIQVELRFYNVLESTERNNCLRMIESAA